MHEIIFSLKNARLAQLNAGINIYIFISTFYISHIFYNNYFIIIILYMYYLYTRDYEIISYILFE